MGKIVHITKTLAIALCFWLLAEIFQPGMMLFPEDSSAVVLYQLYFFVVFVRWFIFIYVALEIFGLFFERLFADIAVSVAFILLALFLVKNFFIMW